MSQEIYAWRTPRDLAAREIEPQFFNARGRTWLAQKVLDNEELRQRKLDITGETYGRWTALHRVGAGKMYMCRCVCGKHKKVSMGALRGGSSRSCGCLARELHRQQARNIHPKAIAAIKAKSAAKKLKARKAAA